MGRISSTLTAVCAATLLTVGVAAAQGTLADRKTIVTFSGPVSIPGATLPAGTYVFRLADSQANRHIVQIFDRDEMKIVTTLLALPAQRAEQEGDPVVAFKEMPSNLPPAVRYWFYAGEKAGNEFVYPRSQAMVIARASGEPVPAFDTDATDLDAWKKGAVTKVSADADAPAASTPPTAAPATTAPTMTAPAPAPVTSAPSIAASQPEQPVGTSGKTETLPRTASELPLVLLLGVLAIMSAFGVRVARRALV